MRNASYCRVYVAITMTRWVYPIERRIPSIGIPIQALRIVRPGHDAIRADEARQQRRIHPRVAGAQRRSPQGIAIEANTAFQPLAGDPSASSGQDANQWDGLVWYLLSPKRYRQVTFVALTNLPD